MNIVGINGSSHNASVVLMKNDEIIFHLESERLSHIKYDNFPFLAMSKIKEYVDHVDIIAFSGFNNTHPYDYGKVANVYQAYIFGLHKTFNDYSENTRFYDFGPQHHAMHASCAFYNSGFTDSLVVVKDAAGSVIKSQNSLEQHMIGRESSSFFLMEYPYESKLIKQHQTVPFKLHNETKWISDEIYQTNSVSEGSAFDLYAEASGFTSHDAGKIMGMSAYGKYEKKVPNIYLNGLINKGIFSFETINKSGFNYSGVDFNDFQSKANFAYALQKQIQDKVAIEILEMLKKTKKKQLCLSGGFFLNCVSNYNLLKQLPKNVEIYVEPIATDAGTAIGAAKTAYYLETKSKKINKQNTIYYGPKYKYTEDDFIKEKSIKDVKPSYVAKLISEKNIVAIYQGGSESGPRALGNRSILYDPRDPNGKDHVNKVKNREWFRPFAGTVLQEHANEWFDLYSIKESKFMMFAVNVKEDKRHKIPAITHIDGSCRVQTLKEEDNKNFYSLIKEFYKITDVPILFNTSFNLAGDTIVETLEDALWTFHNSEINYLYLPELKILIKK
jgi:carbamoyltransferase